MEQNPKNCRNNCPFHQTGKCPAIVFEQTEHMHGFSNLVQGVTPVIGCAAYPEPEQTIVQQPVAQPEETESQPAKMEPVKKAPCPGAPKKKK